MENFTTFLKGIVLGLANVIPGVSGGTMAVVLNVYDKIIDNVSIKGIKKHFFFFLSLGIGMVVGIIAFSSIVSYFFTNHTLYTTYFFMGIILGSIPMIYKKTKSSKLDIFSIIIAVLFFLSLFIINTLPQSEAITSVTGFDFKTSSIMFVSGAIAAFAMIIPGISGSFLLLVLGVYEIVVGSISEFNLFVLIPFGFGALTGLLLGLKLVKYLLHKWPKQTYMAILGLVVGSISTLYMTIPFNLSGAFAVLMLLIGAFISNKFSD